MKNVFLLVLLALSGFVAIDSAWGQTPQLSKDELIYFKNVCVKQLKNPQTYPSPFLYWRSVYAKTNSSIPINSVIDSFESLPYNKKTQDKVFSEVCIWSYCKEYFLSKNLESIGLTGKILNDFTRYIGTRYSYLCQAKANAVNQSDISQAKTPIVSSTTYIENEKYSIGGLYLDDYNLRKNLPSEYKRIISKDSIEAFRKTNNYDNVYQFYNNQLLYANCEDTSLCLDNGFKVGMNKESFKALFHYNGELSNTVFLGIHNFDEENPEFDKSKGINFFFQNDICTRISVIH